MDTENHPYHKLLLVILRLRVDVVLKELGGSAFDVSTVLPIEQRRQPKP